MSHIQKAEQAIKTAAFDLGVPELAKRAGVNENTARKLLRDPPAAIANLKKLEIVALKHQEEEKA